MVEISGLSRQMLRELCTDSRATITELSGKLRITRHIAKKRIESLERDLGLKYALDLNYNALGFTKMHLYYLKFSKKPDQSAIEEFMSKSDMVQLAMMTKGDFDVVMFVLASNEEEYAKWHLSIALDLAKYGVSFSKSDIDIIHHGFVPLTDKMIELSSVDEIYKRLLVELNRDSRASISSIAKRLNLGNTMVSYYMKKMVDDGIIRRFTTVITNPHECFNVLFFVRYTYREGHVSRIYDKRRLVYFKKEAEIPMYNSYQMVLSISGGEEDFAWASAPTADEADELVETHRRIFRKDTPEIRKGTVVKVLKGFMPIRSVDIKAGYQKTQWGPGENYTGD